MNWFYDFCVMFLPGIMISHIFAIFCMDDSRFQKIRVRKSLERIYTYALDRKEPGHIQPEVDVTYKNKQFKVGVFKDNVNSQYAKYDIYINGELAGHYHRLAHDIVCSYYFEEENHRSKDEVIAIVHAASKAVRKKVKETTEKEVTPNYSYFK